MELYNAISGKSYTDPELLEINTLPLRFLWYISKLYMGMTRKSNIYGTEKVEIPEPQFVVFYNGVEVYKETNSIEHRGQVDKGFRRAYTGKGRMCTKEESL